MPTRTITKRLTITVTIGLTVTVTAETTTVALAIAARTITKRLTITITELAALTLAVAARTITKRLTITITAETTTVALAIAARTITKRLTITITAETTTVTLAIAARTVPKRLTITITVGFALSASGSTAAGEVAAVPVRPRPEAAGLTAGVVVAAERAAVVAAVATVVLGHLDSSCCEPTTGATAAARFVSYATRNQALRSPYIFINSSGAAKSPGTVGALAAVSWRSSHQALPLLSQRPLISGRFSLNARSRLAGSLPTPAHVWQVFP